MKLVLTLLVRDEADIIESNLEYHLNAGVDFIIATDNGSVDGTTEVLRRYEAQGLLEYGFQAPRDFSQHVWVTQMARRAADVHGADWVVNGDGDEFFVADGASLKGVLEQVPSCTGVIRVQRHDFVPFERPGSEAPPAEMVYRKKISLTLRGERLAPKVMHRGTGDVTVSQGNHEVRSSAFQDGGVECPHIEIFHFPVRSTSQFESKVRNGGSGYARNEHLHHGVGFHKRYWYELLTKGQLEQEYERHFFDALRLEQALARGELTEDRKLRNQLRRLDGLTGAGT